MGKKRIKGIVVKIGGDVTDLDKSLQGVNKRISTTQSELKDVERLLKLDPTNTQLLEQKQRLLAKAVSETESKLGILNEAGEKAAKSVENYEDWAAAYNPIKDQIDETSQKLRKLRDSMSEMENLGDIDTEAFKKLAEEALETEKHLQELKKQAKAVSDEFGNPVSPDQYDSLQREIAETKISLRTMEDQAKDTRGKLEQIDEQPIEDVTHAAEDAGDALEDAGEDAASFGDILKAEMIADGAKELLSSVKDLAEETREYRKIQGSLEVSSAAQGYSAEQTREAYKRLFGVLADDQSAATTLANLQALGLEQDKLMELLDDAIGGWARYGDSIPIDGLAESINETAKAGKITGTFADILNWGAKEGETYGVSLREANEENEEWNKAVEACASAEDYFNLALQECATEAERVDLIMRVMADQGLSSAAEAWRENNASMVEANEVSSDMQAQLAELGERIEPLITKVTQFAVQMLDWFNGLSDGTQLAVAGALAAMAVIPGLINSISGITGAIGQISKSLPMVKDAFSSVFSFIAANPIVLLIAAIAALVVFIGTKGDEIQSLLQRVNDFVQNIFAKDWTEVFGPVLGETLNRFFHMLKGIWDSVMQIFNGVIDFIRGVFTADWQRAWEGVKSIFAGVFNGLIAIAKQPINAIIGFINDAIGGINLLIEKVNNIPGISIPLISGKIPYLANGGEVIRGSAVVGDAGPELLTVAEDRTIVQPLTGSTVNHTTSMGGVNINIYPSAGQDADEIADAVMERIQYVYGTEEAALT